MWGDEVDFILGELVSSILIGIGFLPELLGVCWHQAPTGVVSKGEEQFSTSQNKTHVESLMIWMDVMENFKDTW